MSRYVSAADSLLYGPVTLVVEGASEVIGLPFILYRLWKEGVSGFESVPSVLPLVHFLDGCGDSFDLLCRVAQSNGSRPVVFLDGDKRGSRLNTLTAKCPDVPVVLLDGTMEFEELVPTAAYLKALAAVMQEFNDRATELLTETAYENWNKAQNFAPQMAFSKRVDRWVQDTLQTSVEKPLVMKKVLTEVPLSAVAHAPLLELLGAITQELRRM